MNTPLFPDQDLTIPISDDRDPLDRYYTLPWAIRPLTCTLGRRIKGTRAWEPCAGGGAIVRELESWCSWVWSSDLDPDATADVVGVDFLGFDSDSAPTVDWIVTNFPYRGVANFVRHALLLADRVAALLRLSFLEACRDRQDILLDCQLTDLLILPRIPFGGPAGELVRQGKQSSDHMTHAWFVWDRLAEHDNTQILHFPEVKP